MGYAVFHSEGDMMNTGAFVFQKSGNSAIWGSGFQQLQLGFSHLQERSSHLLVFI